MNELTPASAPDVTPSSGSPSLTGTVDIGHLPHPVLMHLRTFFDLWDSFTLQAVQSGQPYISDHIMFEVRRARRNHTARAVSIYSSCFEFMCPPSLPQRTLVASRV